MNRLYRGCRKKSEFLHTEIALIALTLVIAAAPFQFHQPAFAQTAGTSTSFSSADIEFASNIELVRAHLREAASDKTGGDVGLANMQVSEALTERYAAILEPRIQATDPALNSTIKQSLSDLTRSVNSSSSSDFDRSVEKIGSYLDGAWVRVLPTAAASDPKFNASVSANIASTAGNEYAEAVKAAGQVSEQFEYQNAKAFAQSSESVFNRTSFAGNSNVTARFAKLQSDISSVSDPAIVGSDVTSVVQAISGLAGIQAQGANSDIQLVGYVDKTRAALNDALKEYKAGNFTGADNLVTAGYLDDFENVEPVLVKNGAQDLKDQTEQMIRVQLRQLISDRVPAEQVAAKIDAIDANLDRISAAVPEFPIALLALVPAMGFAVLVARRARH